MKAHEMMITQVYKVKESDTVQNVIEKFLKYRISGLPVVNERNEITGYISDGDIMRYIGRHEDRVIDSLYYLYVIQGDHDNFEGRLQKLLKMNVMMIAQKKVIKIDWDEEIDKIAATLGKKHIKKLPVERNGVLVGIVSRGDVIRYAFKSIL
ncbi:CBS domain-containing protein [Paenibacillus sp. JX-17]|uniref:CBS domain-containing protein n=1 Tax=Paenibacillus lacisoli TaxID=3064525 RepID=A0ABT9C6E2_9BACL|nr:CBS domain-containing protein [Paenibacillus sp. JX-17]MDO7904829.1 CBS domain-containing protein [Paenibacillus sp. JX-17]